MTAIDFGDAMERVKAEWLTLSEEERQARRAKCAPPVTVKKPLVVLDCHYLGEVIRNAQGVKGRVYRECEMNHGPQSCCDSPRKCGQGFCSDYLKGTTK